MDFVSIGQVVGICTYQNASVSQDTPLIITLLVNFMKLVRL